MHIIGLGGAIFIGILALAVALFLYFMSGLFGERTEDPMLTEANTDIYEDI